MIRNIVIAGPFSMIVRSKYFKFYGKNLKEKETCYNKRKHSENEPQNFHER